MFRRKAYYTGEKKGAQNIQWCHTYDGCMHKSGRMKEHGELHDVCKHCYMIFPFAVARKSPNQVCGELSFRQNKELRRVSKHHEDNREHRHAPLLPPPWQASQSATIDDISTNPDNVAVLFIGDEMYNARLQQHPDIRVIGVDGQVLTFVQRQAAEVLANGEGEEDGMDDHATSASGSNANERRPLVDVHGNTTQRPPKMKWRSIEECETKKKG